MTRANLPQIREDLEAARARIEETYYEWAVQLAREAASDAFRLLETEAGLASPPQGEIGTLADRVASLTDRGLLDGELAEPAGELDDVLDPALEPDYDPGLAQREGGSADYLEAGDAREAVEAAAAIVDACTATLADEG